MPRGSFPSLTHQGRSHRACNLVGRFRCGTCAHCARKTTALALNSPLGRSLPQLAPPLGGARGIFKIVRIAPSRCNPQNVLARHRVPIAAGRGGGGSALGSPHSFFHAGTIFAFEAANRAVKMLTGWMPARIGADEGASAGLVAALGLASGAGLALALTRRSRDLLCCAVGFPLRLTWHAGFETSQWGEGLPCKP